MYGRMSVRMLLGIVAVTAVVLGVAVALAASENGEPPAPRPLADHFDAERAWSLVELQVGHGQRPAGSPALRSLAAKLVRMLPRGHFEPVPDRGLRNVVGFLPGRLPGLVIGAHYDTLASPRGFLGANNGAAGTAVVVQLARDLRRLVRPADARRVTFALFDGEEPAEGLPGDHVDFYAVGLRGSKAFVRDHGDETMEMVLLDYVGNRGLQLPREGSSSPELWRRIRAAAHEVGAGPTFPATTQTTIIDDHTPFLRAGIPAVDLIDWSYDGHSLSDGLDKLSMRSLDAVGETMYEFVRRFDRAGG